jgi:hypothetical protein
MEQYSAVVVQRKELLDLVSLFLPQNFHFSSQRTQ